MIDINSLTLGEIERVEQRARQGIGTLQDSTAPKATLMRALVFELMRRDNPAVTWDETGKLTMQQLTDYLDLGGDADEKKGS